MTTRKRNEWLDTRNSDEELEDESELEDQEESRVQRAAKRRRINTFRDSDLEDDDKDDEDNEDAEFDLHDDPAVDGAGETAGDDEDNEEDEVGKEDENSDAQHHEPGDNDKKTAFPLPRSSKPAKHPLDPVETRNPAHPRSSTTTTTTKKKDKTGVIYLSRIPPFMKPLTVRHLLSRLGPINRIFLTPEAPSTHSLRVRSGGNKKRSFTDGWVEFLSKRDAKMAASALNARPIGGKKGSWYRDDVWNIRYLKGFKWGHLTEQIANENAERASRMRAEISRTTRENRRFVEGVERGKMLEGMERKKRGRGTGAGDEGGNGNEDGDGAMALHGGDAAAAANQGHGLDEVDVAPRTTGKKHTNTNKTFFRQNAVLSKKGASGRAAADDQPEQVRRVLSKIF